MAIPTSEEKLIVLLLARLERIPADSYWAHRASGVRGNLLEVLEKIEKGTPDSMHQIQALIDQGFHILLRSAKEKPKVSESTSGQPI